tara:strand:+ start:268 stop:507 length:240 start_codon:yes stop_codon:yes gene_type:complete
MKSQNIPSPCISICKNDPETGLCYGCARNNSEKKIWKDQNTSEEWKNINLSDLRKRMSHSQLERFEESYLIKKNKFTSI